ncbi:hypothetical protein [Ornithinimicrobium kibberense]|uniref:hypothetical protein n=1 Tax=Ornithinimicrobium kibberense TaxID=282060 RepID=UPI003615767C
MPFLHRQVRAGRSVVKEPVRGRGRASCGASGGGCPRQTVRYGVHGALAGDGPHASTEPGTGVARFCMPLVTAPY